MSNDSQISFASRSVDEPAEPQLGPRRRYCLIAPCRDEAGTLERTVLSIARQTVLPALLVIVDDGSRDATPQIAAKLAARYPWLRVMSCPDRGKRSVGPGVIETFYAGLQTIDLDSFDYVGKLDCDLEMPERYYETVLTRMEQDPRLAALSGKPWYHKGGDESGELVPEPCGPDICVGAVKFYRVAAFRAIGGFVRAVMWDGIDAHTCRMLGWRNEALDIEELRFLHLRPMGSSERSILEGRRRWGRGQWFMGTGLFYMLASAVWRVPARPFLIGSVCMVLGWLEGWYHCYPRHGTPEFRRFLARYHRLALRVGKARACEIVLGPREIQAPR